MDSLELVVLEGVRLSRRVRRALGGRRKVERVPIVGWVGPPDMRQCD